MRFLVASRGSWIAGGMARKILADGVQSVTQHVPDRSNLDILCELGSHISREHFGSLWPATHARWCLPGQNLVVGARQQARHERHLVEEVDIEELGKRLSYFSGKILVSLKATNLRPAQEVDCSRCTLFSS